MPKEIKEMPEKDRKAFLKAVKESKTVSRRFVRIMIVGKNGAGKTSLLKRILNENVDITKIKSTDGINIEIRKCQINLQTEEWTYFSEANNSIQDDSDNDIAYCGFWDFAGQEDYYATHQTFLTANAIYLLVVNMSDDFNMKTINKNIDSGLTSVGDYINFWVDNIHWYAVDETFTDNKTLCPPVLLVGTFIDKIEEENVPNVSKKFSKYRNTFIGESEKKKHIIGDDVIFVSNADPERKDSQHGAIKQIITEFAKESKPANLPVQWILMEKVLAQMSFSGEKVIEYSDVVEIADDKNMLSDIDLFLRYEHDIGNIIFFQDVKDYVILDHEWLVDAFRCLVAPSKILTSKIKENGRYSIRDIQSFLNKCPYLVTKVEFLVQIFEKFDILVKPHDSLKESEYYMPCMMSAESTKQIWDDSEIKDGEYIRTSWLCIEFKFLPPALFNHVLAWYVRHYTICVNEETPALSKNIGIFYISCNRINRITLFKSLNSIALQVLNVKTENIRYSQFKMELISTVRNFFSRYGRRPCYRLTLLCPDGLHFYKDGKDDIPTIKKITGKYRCQEHQRIHDIKSIYNSWFGETPQSSHVSGGLVENGEYLQYICEFCSNTRNYLCEKCQQNMCYECFDKHQPEQKNKHHTIGHIYDKYSIERTFNISPRLCTDMVITPDGLLVCMKFYVVTLVTYETEGDTCNREGSVLQLDRPSTSLTVIDNNTVAVACFDGCVLIVDIRRLKIIKTLELESTCSGLTFKDDLLYVGCADSPSWTIKVIDISGGRVKKTIPVSYGPRCLRYGGNGCIYCLTYERVIVGFDMDWNEVFILNDLNIISKNITIDNDGDALVFSKDHGGSVIKITSTGKHYHVLSLKGIGFGSVLIFHPESRKLFINEGYKIDVWRSTES